MRHHPGVSPPTRAYDTCGTHRTCQASLQRAVHIPSWGTLRYVPPTCDTPRTHHTTLCCDTSRGATCPRVPWSCIPVRPGASRCTERAAGSPCVREWGGGGGGGAAVTHNAQNPPLLPVFALAGPSPAAGSGFQAGFTPAPAWPVPNQTQPGSRTGGDGRDGRLGWSHGGSRAGGPDTRMRMMEEGDGGGCQRDRNGGMHRMDGAGQR